MNGQIIVAKTVGQLMRLVRDGVILTVQGRISLSGCTELALLALISRIHFRVVQSTQSSVRVS